MATSYHMSAGPDAGEYSVIQATSAHESTVYAVLTNEAAATRVTTLLNADEE